MKRKPNKPRPEAQTHTEPGGGAAEPGGSAFGAGSEQEPGASGTSGQSVPKSKFRQKSQQEQAAASKLRIGLPNLMNFLSHQLADTVRSVRSR